MDKKSNSDFEKLKITSQLPLCSGCHNQFKPVKHYQLYCSDKCEDSKKEMLQDKRDSYFEKECVKCGDKFRRTDERSLQTVCYGCKKKYNREAMRKREKPIKEPEKRKLVSYDELNRRSEYKRLFDESGWDHYLKGRKWNRI